MEFSRINNIRLIKITTLTLFVVFIVIFVAFRSLNYILGPEIVINEPKENAVIYNPEITLSGQASRINYLAINGRAITIDESGNWNDVLLLFPGINSITMTARDRFNRSIEKYINIYGQF